MKSIVMLYDGGVDHGNYKIDYMSLKNWNKTKIVTRRKLYFLVLIFAIWHFNIKNTTQSFKNAIILNLWKRKELDPLISMGTWDFFYDWCEFVIKCLLNVTERFTNVWTHCTFQTNANKFVKWLWDIENHFPNKLRYSGKIVLV